MINKSDKVSDFPPEFNSLEKRVKFLEEQLESLTTRVLILESQDKKKK